MPEYLVTGGCGFIGSHLCETLLRRGDQVRVLDDLSTGCLENVPPEAILMEGDIRDARVVSAAMAGCAGCFHLAAIASVERGRLEWLETHRINLFGTLQVFDVARQAGPGGCPLPVYASSAAVYGDQVSRLISEALLPLPVSAYGADKLSCEHHARVAALVHGVPTTGLRFFNVYGPRQDPRSPYSGVISIFCDRIGRGLPVTVFGDGQQTRDFIYVGDLVKGLLTAMDRVTATPDVLNLCTGRSVSIGELAAGIARLVGRELRIVYRAPREGEIRHSVGDPARARAVLGFEAETSLAEGLQMTIAAGEHDGVSRDENAARITFECAL